ncbi:MAG: alpha-hydroxy-acid oxidizing protein [Hyphomicrobiales bacterium]|nr:alpha-hydroxy-acid oxidizing protein [Hyphomicrobiales bacterium]
MDSADLDALEEQARVRLSPGAYAFAAAGADDELTLADNIAAWRRLRLRPRMLEDITAIDTSVEILGQRLATPVMVAPFGRHKLFHPEGERATARGASAAGAVLVLPTTSTIGIEEVAQEPASAPRWFQLYLPPDRASTESLIDRVAAAGFGALVLTVDQPVYGSSPRAARSPLAPSPDIRNANLPGQPIAQNSYKPGYSGRITFPATWRDLAWLVGRSPLPVLVKGILRGDDAVRCLEAGAGGVIVSNHGGRHLDGSVASAEALAEVAAALAGRGALIVDGGIRRGTDIVKALALGARAVMVARPLIWGLALEGSEGVRAVLDHFKDELVRSMALCGAARLDRITRDLVAAASTA